MVQQQLWQPLYPVLVPSHRQIPLAAHDTSTDPPSLWNRKVGKRSPSLNVQLSFAFGSFKGVEQIKANVSISKDTCIFEF